MSVHLTSKLNIILEIELELYQPSLSLTIHRYTYNTTRNICNETKTFDKFKKIKNDGDICSRYPRMLQFLN